MAKTAARARGLHSDEGGTSILLPASPPVRRVLLLLVGLLALGVVACRWESAPAPAASTAGPRWLRTTDGWERADDVLRDRSRYAPPLHPLTVAAGQLLAALTAFVLFPPERGKRRVESGERRAKPRGRDESRARARRPFPNTPRPNEAPSGG